MAQGMPEQLPVNFVHAAESGLRPSSSRSVEQFTGHLYVFTLPLHPPPFSLVGPYGDRFTMELRHLSRDAGGGELDGVKHARSRISRVDGGLLLAHCPRLLRTQRQESIVNPLYIVCGLIAAGLLIYLTVALLMPEKF